MRHLLDVIAENLDIVCLSDMHVLYQLHFNFSPILLNIPNGQYSLDEWERAVRYILEDYELSLESEEEARRILNRNI